MLSGCEQLGDSRYRRQKSHRGFAPSFAAEHRRGSYGEQRSPDLAGKYGRRPWNMMSPALHQLLRSFSDILRSHSLSWNLAGFPEPWTLCDIWLAAVTLGWL